MHVSKSVTWRCVRVKGDGGDVRFWYKLPGVSSGVQCKYRKRGVSAWTAYRGDHPDPVRVGDWWHSPDWCAPGQMEYEQSCWVDGVCVKDGVFGPEDAEILPGMPAGSVPGDSGEAAVPPSAPVLNKPGLLSEDVKDAQQVAEELVPQKAVLNKPGLLSDDVKDAQQVTYKPLAKFAEEFAPQKTVDQYLKEDAQQVENICQHTGPFMDRLLEESWIVTRDKVKNGKVLDKHAGLIEDSVFAIVVFTMEISSFCLAAVEDSEFYKQYNDALRERQPGSMKLLAGYSHFLFKGLNLLPKHEGVLWRGIRNADAVKLVLDNYDEEWKEIHWCAFSSASPDRDVAKSFAKSGGLLFKLTVCACARDIRSLSAIPAENERLVLPNAKFIIQKAPHRSAEDNMWEVHMHEVKGTFHF